MYEYVVIKLTYHLVVTINNIVKLTIPQRKEPKDLCKETLVKKLTLKLITFEPSQKKQKKTRHIPLKSCNLCNLNFLNISLYLL